MWLTNVQAWYCNPATWRHVIIIIMAFKETTHIPSVKSETSSGVHSPAIDDVYSVRH